MPLPMPPLLVGHRRGSLAAPQRGGASFRSILFRMVNPQRFPGSELVEHNPKLDVDALYRAGALFTGQISRWACHWLTVRIRAEWERIWIDDQEVAIRT